MNDILKYIDENEVDVMFKQIINSNKDIRKVIQDIRRARTTFQIKSQQLQTKLQEYIGYDD